ncbi:hypothetical protein BA896_003165 [Janthinobacterium lividum]|uniref:FimV N-terminal domain-containing protein n=1 Tax=Janthinobacterium lividum TaxID=29581 RepID=A0A1E8PP84_9BURK|nr:hypothetical protein BA896_003165 [Janthinobacterium lividum]
MQSSIVPRWSLLACAAASLALSPVMAAELGEMALLSHVGQPLLVEIELTALAPEEAGGVSVRLASPDVYRGGGISMDPALKALTISPLERGGRRYVRVSTAQAIQAGYVHLYLLLGNGNGAIVRLATLWLTPAPPATAIVASASAPVRPAIAAPVPLSVPLSPPLPLPRAAPGAPPPDLAALAARARAEGLVRPARVFVPPPAAPTLAGPPPLRRAKAPAGACVPQAKLEQAQECVALDQKNAALNEKLGELEGKIGALQKALALPVVAAVPVAVAEAPHAKPKPLKAVAPADKEAKAGGNGLLWLGIGTLAFVLLTALIVYVVRKRKHKRKQAPGTSAPSKYWVLLRKPFGRKKEVPVLTEAVEAEVAEPEVEPFSR